MTNSVIEEPKEAFRHRVSKGSRYNQIYIPKGMEKHFSVGDIVEIRLIEHKERFNYLGNMKMKLKDTKIEIIKHIFLVLKDIKEIEQIIVFGSFLTEKIDYRDIDILILSKKKKIEEDAYSALAEKIPAKFHIISLQTSKLNELLEFCPLTRSMLYYAVSNKKIDIPEKISLNKEHLRFLLMMPEDLLKIRISNSRVYFDNIRRLITICRFLKKESLDPLLINLEMKKEMGILYGWCRNNEVLKEENYKALREVIEKKLNESKILLNSS